MTTAVQRIDQYPMPDGTVKILPCVCQDSWPCLWHWAKERDAEAKRKQEEFYARPDRSKLPEYSPSGGGRPDAPVRGDRHSDARGNGKGSAKAARKPPRKR